MSRKAIYLLVLACCYTAGCTNKNEPQVNAPTASDKGGTSAAPSPAEPSPPPAEPTSPAVEPLPTEPSPAEPTPTEPAPAEPAPGGPPIEEPALPANEPAPPSAPALPSAATEPHRPSVSLVELPQEMPVVALSDAHAATCRIKVGDLFPVVSLPNLAGESQDLASLYGKALTVVVLWQANNPYAVFELKDLQNNVVAPFAEAGVTVVGINIRDPQELASQAATAAGATFPQLLDAQGTLFDAVATARLPRTYLLDASGKVLWFDLEYSLETRRHLLQAIHHSLRP